MTLNEIRDKIVKDSSEILLSAAKENKYCVVDRVHTIGFGDVFREAMYNYNMNYIIIERLFKSESCADEVMTMDVYTDETQECMQKFEDILLKLQDGGIEELEKNKSILEELNDKIRHPDTEKKDIRVKTYQADFSKYILFELNESIEPTLTQICSVYADFAIMAARFFNFSAITPDSSPEIFVIDGENYKDIAVRII